MAFKGENNSINYGDLQEEAQRIGASINIILNGATRKPIVVFIDRSIKSLISFIGVVYSGNFYVPIDCTQPRERIELIFDILKPALSIGHYEIKGHISKIGDIENLHYYEDFIARKVDTSGIDTVQRSMINTDPLYAMFTSGSTGVPKGAVTSHFSVIDLVDEFSREFKFTENTIFGNQAPFDFDESVKDNYSNIKHGSTLSIIPKVCFSFPSMLIAYLEKEKTDTCIWSTSVLRLVVNLKGLDAAKPTSLKMIMFSGEVMPNKILNFWRRHLPEVT